MAKSKTLGEQSGLTTTLREEENAHDTMKLPGDGTCRGLLSKETEFALPLERVLYAERLSRGGNENTAPDYQNGRNF